MAGYKRKRSTTATRARRVRRRMSRPSRPGRCLSPVFTVKRKVFVGTYTWSSAFVSGFWNYIRLMLQDVPNYQEYTSVFDEYKIAGLKYEFRPQYDAYTSASVTQNLGALHLSSDQASSVVPVGIYGGATLNTFFESCQNVRSYKADQVGTLYIRNPKVQEQVTGSTSFGVERSAPWIKTDSAQVKHGGVHAFQQTYSPSNGTIGPSYDFYVTFYMHFRGNR